MSHLRQFLYCQAGAFLLLTGIAAAAPGQDATLGVEVESCEHLSTERLKELLSLELSTLGREPGAQAISISVRCGDDEVRIQGEIEGYPALDRRIVGEVSAMNERSLALAGSELIAEIWASPSPAEPADETAEPTWQHSLESQKKPPAHRIILGATSVFFTKPNRFNLGGEARFLYRLGRGSALAAHVEVGAGLGATFGREEFDLARIHQSNLTLTPEARLIVPWSHLALGIGLSVPIAWAWMSPHDEVEGADARPFSAPWSAVMADVELRIPSQSAIFASARVSGGWVTVPIVGVVHEDSRLAIEDFVASASLGLGFAF